MAGANITASVVVEFGDSSSDSATLEIDDRDTGYNGGNTSFSKGTSAVGLLLFIPYGYIVTGMYASLGQLVDSGATTKEVDDVLSFANEDSQALKYPHWSNVVTLTPLGSNHSGISYSVSGETVSLNKRPNDANGMPVPKYRVAACKVAYLAPCRLLVLRNIPASAEAVVVLVTVAKA